MKQSTILVVAGLALAFASTLRAQEIKHEFFCADYSGGRVALVDKEGKITWDYKAPSCNEIWALPNGNLLFTTGHGVIEVTRDKKVVFKYESKSEIYACQRLPNGNTFVGECNAGRLLEVAPDGKIVKELNVLPKDLPAGKDGGHAFIRNARVLPNGNYLVTHYGMGCVREYDQTGKVVWEVKVPGGVHSVVRLPNGNTLIASGDGQKLDMDEVDVKAYGPQKNTHDPKKRGKVPNARVFEVDKDGTIVWEVGNKDLPDAPLRFMTGVQRLANGNTMITNWLGHGHTGEAPHIFEVTRDKKVVWTYSNHADFKTISSIQILDTPADCVKGEVLH